MFKKTLVYVVLAAMMLHCGSRIGVISYLYEKRDNIAFSLGLISEVPIAVCSSQYSTPTDLRLIVEDAASKAPSIVIAQEINLFVVENISFIESFNECLPLANSMEPFAGYHYLPVTTVFHPPSA